MTRDQIDLQQYDKQESLSRGDEALGAAHDGLMEGSPTLVTGSYRLTCRPYSALDERIKHQ
jgi:hypothetical protein